MAKTQFNLTKTPVRMAKTIEKHGQKYPTRDQNLCKLDQNPLLDVQNDGCSL